MKISKTTCLVFSLTLLLFPLILSAQDSAKKTDNNIERRFNVSKASRLIKSTIFLNVNFDLMKKNGILNLFHDDKIGFTHNILGDIPTIPDEYSSLYFYSSGKKYDVNIVVDGDFKNISILDHVKHIIKNNKRFSEILNVKSKKYKLGMIHTLKIKIKEPNNQSKMKKIYIGEINNSRYIISFNLYDVRDAIIQPIIGSQLKAFNNKNLAAQFSFFVKKTVDKNTNVKNYTYQSLALKELDRVIISLSLHDNNLEFSTILSASDVKKAKNVFHIISGILAINQLSNDKNKINTILSNNVKTTQKSKHIFIGSYIPLSEVMNTQK